MRTALLIACAAVALSACSKTDTKTVTASDGAKVSIDSSQGKVKIEADTKEGKSVIESGAGIDVAKLAERLPSYAPLYPGAEVARSQFADEADAKRRSIVLMSSADPPAKVAAFYRERLKTSGLHELALSIAERYGLSIYDALIFSSALLAGCKTLHSEAMQDGQVIDRQLTTRNPFKLP